MEGGEVMDRQARGVGKTIREGPGNIDANPPIKSRPDRRTLRRKRKILLGTPGAEVDPSTAGNTLNEKDKYGNLINRKSTERGDNMAKVTARLKGKVALCVACSVGIGYAVARRLAQEGAHVIIVSRNQVKVDTAVQQLKYEGFLASGFPCDVEVVGAIGGPS